MYFIRVRKSAHGDQATTFPSNFVSYWYVYLQTNFLIPFLIPLTENEYVTSSFHFTEEICKQDPNLYMAGLDVDFLFTS